MTFFDGTAVQLEKLLTSSKNPVNVFQKKLKKLTTTYRDVLMQRGAAYEVL